MRRSLFYLLGFVLCILTTKPVIGQITNQNFSAITASVIFDGKWANTDDVSLTSTGPAAIEENFTFIPPTITLPASLPAATVGVAYNKPATASGGTAPYVYAITTGALPAGLSLSASTGAVTGIPTAGGTFHFTITATDNLGFTGSQAYTFSVTAPTITLAPTTISLAQVGIALNQTITASGGTAGYTYMITAGALPAGLTLAANGTLSGTATAGGTFNFTITATDSSTGTGPYTGSKAYTLTLTSPPYLISPATLNAGTVGVAYSQVITASGATAPYTYRLKTGALPPGMTVASDGTLSGTPTAGGTFNFTIGITDSSTGTGPFTAGKPYTFTINPPTITLSPASSSLGTNTSPLSFNQTITASGGTGPYTYAVTAGALPAGITLSSGGIISGTATELGTFNFTITATDSSTGTGPYTGSKAYTLNINGVVLTITSTLPTVTVGTFFSQSLTTSANPTINTPQYTYTVTAGALPAGVTLTPGGLFSGTPTEGGTFNFTVTSTDNSGGAGPYSTSKSYTFTVNAPTIAIQPLPLPDASSVTAYSQSLTSFNGTAPYSYAITAGALPPGLTLSSSGTISGTAMSLGTFNFTITSTDSSTGTGPYTKAQPFSITVSGPIITVSPTSTAALAPAQVGVPYTQTFTAAGTGSTGLYTFAISAGTLPPGLTLATDGTLSGTPTAVGTNFFSVRATDSSPSPGPYTGARLYLGFTVSAPTIVVGPATIPNGTAGVAYSQSIVATGGTAPYIYTVSGGLLPPGVTLATDGTLSGTSNVTGSYSFTIQAVDSSTGTGSPFNASTSYTLNFVAPVITLPASLPAATVDVAYNKPATASGGTAPYAYAITTGALPAGLSLSASTGAVTGIPTAGGTFHFTITATDNLGFTGSQAYTFSVTAPTITIAPTTISLAQVGIALNQTITASGGTAGYTYTITAGALPAGLTLAANGTLSGTATAGGTFNFTITATDSSTGTGPYTSSKAYTLTLTFPPFLISPATLNAGTVGVAYSQVITASGATAPYTYAITTGALPAGLSLSASTGAITGIPTAAGTFNFTITATDASTGSGPYSVSAVYDITVGKGTQTIAFAAINVTYGDGPITLTGTASSGLGVTYSSSNTAVATVSGNTLTILSAGTATITASQAGNSSYNAALAIAQTLTVNAKSLVVSAAAKSKIYGTADPALTYQITSGSLVGTDTFTGTLTRNLGEPVNTYAIKQGTLALNSNYIITYIGANLTITPASLTIKADDKTRAYNATDPAFTVSYTGLTNGDTQASLTTQSTVSTTTTPMSPVGIYPLTVAGAASPNYIISYIPGTFTITQSVLTVTADNKSRNYGDSNPAFTLTYAGFNNGDDASKLTTAPVAVSSSTATTLPGSYPISVSGGVSANYIFNYVPGTLSIVALNNANLNSLTTSSGSLSPLFSTNTLAYNVSVDNSIAGLTLTPTYEVTASATVNGAVAPNGSPSFVVPLSVGNNVLTLIVTAQDGVTKKTYTVNVYRGLEPASITPTNILTPNNDGKNDYWIIKDIQLYPNNTVKVYDKGGRVVFSKKGYTNDWGGTLNDTNLPLATGTYYYIVDLGVGAIVLKGYISIIRSR